MKHVDIRRVIRAAEQVGLWVLASGAGQNLKYEFWNRTTGKLALTYYPATRKWLSGDGQREGRSDTYEDAITAALAAAS